MSKKKSKSGGGGTRLGKPTPLLADVVMFARAGRKFGCRDPRRTSRVEAALEHLKAHANWVKRNALDERSRDRRLRAVNRAVSQVKAAERCTPAQKKAAENRYVRERMRGMKGLKLKPSERTFVAKRFKVAEDALVGRSEDSGSEPTAQHTSTHSEPTPSTRAAAKVQAAAEKAREDLNRAAAQVEKAEKAAKKVVEEVTTETRTQRVDQAAARRANKKKKASPKASPQITLSAFPGITFEPGEMVEMRGRVIRVNPTSGSINLLEPRPATDAALDLPAPPPKPKVLPVLQCCGDPRQFPQGMDLAVRGRITRVNQNGSVTVEEPALLKKGEADKKLRWQQANKPRKKKAKKQLVENTREVITEVDEDGHTVLVELDDGTRTKVRPIRVGNLFLEPGTSFKPKRPKRGTYRGELVEVQRDGSFVIRPYPEGWAV